MDFITYEKLGLNNSLLRDDIVNGRSNNEPRDISGDVNYYHCSDSNKNVPRTIMKFTTSKTKID